jgi:hypothetical protein
MRYTYELIQNGVRQETTTKLDELAEYLQDMNECGDYIINVTDNLTGRPCAVLKNVDDLDGWYEMLARYIWLDGETKEKHKEILEAKAICKAKQCPGCEKCNPVWDPFNEKETGIHMKDNVQAVPEDYTEKVKRFIQPLKKDHINPSHYKNYIEELQWIDAMSRIPTLRDPTKFKAALELQLRKYLDRNGGKDEELQELKKAQFYLMYIIMYIENGNMPIKAVDVHKKLGN